MRRRRIATGAGTLVVVAAALLVGGVPAPEPPPPFDPSRRPAMTRVPAEVPAAPTLAVCSPTDAPVDAAAAPAPGTEASLSPTASSASLVARAVSDAATIRLTAASVSAGDGREAFLRASVNFVLVSKASGRSVERCRPAFEERLRDAQGRGEEIGAATVARWLSSTDPDDLRAGIAGASRVTPAPIAELLEVVRDERVGPGLRAAALESAAALGADRADVVAQVAHSLTDEDMDVSRTAYLVLPRLGDEGARLALRIPAGDASRQVYLSLVAAAVLASPLRADRVGQIDDVALFAEVSRQARGRRDDERLRDAFVSRLLDFLADPASADAGSLVRSASLRLFVARDAADRYEAALRSRLTALADHTSDMGVRYAARDWLDQLGLGETIDLQIRSARYGADERQMDVTALVASLVRRGHLLVEADNTTLGGDPAFGTVKELTVEYDLDGNRHVQTAREGTVLALP